MQNVQSLMTQGLSRQDIRKIMRERRNTMTASQQVSAGEQLCQQIKTLIKPGDVAALYLDNDGEVSTQPTIEYLQTQDIAVLLPVMHSFNKGYLNFQRYISDCRLGSADIKNTPMVKNNFEILEPKLNVQQTYSLEQIDYIFMPLVAFDKQGNRLGMGGGFYDRTLSMINTLTNRPKLCGLAHSCQQADVLPYQDWDIPIDLIITPKSIIEANSQNLLDKTNNS